MKQITKVCLTLILLTSSIRLYAQDQKQKQTPEEAAWMAYMATGNMHKMLAKSAGFWSEEVTMWMAADAPPMKSTMTLMNKMIMGNRYLQGMNRGAFNGMPFEGTSTVGYDNAKKVFVSSWIDNMGTGMMYAEGTWSEATKSITFKGNQVDPMTGKEMKVRQILKFVDENNQTMEIYTTPLSGKEYKSMEIKYSRKTGMPSQFSGPGRSGMTSPGTPPAPVKTDEKK